jgi:hypothetical protein
MHKRKLGRGMGPDQYSHLTHLSRTVQCVDCGVELHKTHNYVLYGHRCHPCWSVATTSGPTASR